MMSVNVAFELVRKKTPQGVFAIKGNILQCACRVCGVALFMFLARPEKERLFKKCPVSDRHADAQKTEVTLPQHTEEHQCDTGTICIIM